MPPLSATPIHRVRKSPLLPTLLGLDAALGIPSRGRFRRGRLNLLRSVRMVELVNSPNSVARQVGVHLLDRLRVAGEHRGEPTRCDPQRADPLLSSNAA